MRLTYVIFDETLLSGDNTAAMVDGYDLIPEAVAYNLVSDAITDTRSRATLRRLYHHPRSGALVVMESRARYFPKGPACLIGLWDQRCRTPSFCDALIRHCDHAEPYHHVGPTTAANGLGYCERCNYVKKTRQLTCQHKDRRNRLAQS